LTIADSALYGRHNRYQLAFEYEHFQRQFICVWSIFHGTFVRRGPSNRVEEVFPIPTEK
jgi:hypothetical protein